MKTATAEQTQGIKATSFEREHDIEPGSPLTKSEVLRETPEQYEERIKRDIERGIRAPLPETVDRAAVDEATRKRELERARVGADLNAAFAQKSLEHQIVPGTRQEAARKPEDGSPGNEGQPPAEQDLDDHTVEELRAIAHRENVELHHDYLKSDIVKAIKKSRKHG